MITFYRLYAKHYCLNVLLCPPKFLKSRCDITNVTILKYIVGYLGPTYDGNHSQCFKVYG